MEEETGGGVEGRTAGAIVPANWALQLGIVKGGCGGGVKCLTSCRRPLTRGGVFGHKERHGRRFLTRAMSRRLTKILPETRADCTCSLPGGASRYSVSRAPN